VGGAGVRLVHDTFHHFVAGETKIFTERTGLVHISVVTDAGATAATMRDRTLAASVHNSATIEADLQASMAYLREELEGA
jgi:hypothetical protein